MSNGKGWRGDDLAEVGQKESHVMSHAPSAYAIEQAMSVAFAVRTRLLHEDPDLAADETALRDTLDGETDVFDVIRQLARFALEAEAMAEVCGARADAIMARGKRFRAREQYARQAIFGMMEALGEKKVENPEFTLSLRAGRPGVVITDETAIPDHFMRVTREPDRAAIGAALKAGQVVDGAELQNGMPSLAIKST
jgi:hypothetical protein